MFGGRYCRGLKWVSLSPPGTESLGVPQQALCSRWRQRRQAEKKREFLRTKKLPVLVVSAMTAGGKRTESPGVPKALCSKWGLLSINPLRSFPANP
jgi:hypothetical protein